MKIFDKKVKMPKDAIWLVPGLRVKRWFALSIMGSVLAFLGLTFIFKLEPLDYIVKFAKELIHIVPPEPVGVVCVILGGIAFVQAWKKTNFSIMGADDENSQRLKQSIGEVLYRRRKLDHGPKIVAIGGGTGLSTLLRGIKKLTNNITAIVTVGDDGGSSGRLREQMGVLPPGDIRNCIAALADDDDIVTKLFQYRFKTGEGLEGHSFGNLFITAMTAICGNMVKAIQESSKVLLIRGRVLPATCDDMKLYARMEDNSIVRGESNIPEAGKKIMQLCCEPSDCKPTPDVVEAILDADLIIMGPGSLYTSIISNFLVKDITRALWQAKAKKIYVCNAMTQVGETDNYSVSDHVKTIFDHVRLEDIDDSEKNFFDAVLVNNSLPANLAEKYEQAGSLPVDIDITELRRLGVEVVERGLLEDNKQGYVRHNCDKVAKAIYYWYKRVSKAK
ncbi:MAG: YvcK family protein [Candidatus Gastranaerophilales bacterium]|nr:YvcK family protein [Candidatus Gastranaerophilales bacterium]